MLAAKVLLTQRDQLGIALRRHSKSMALGRASEDARARVWRLV